MDLNPVPTDRHLDRRTEQMPRQDRRAWWATLFGLCGLLGAMLGLSVKTQNAKQRQDKIDRLQGSEMQFSANLDLQRRIAQLQKDNAQLINAAPSNTRQVKTLSEELVKAQFLAGLTDVKGPGVIVTLNDSKLPFPTSQMPPGMPPSNLVHDTDIIQVVNELKAAKAEAVCINDQRLISTSAIRCAGPTVFVNQEPQTPPYIIKAIGNPKVLATALNLPGGIGEQLHNIDKGMFKVEKSAKPLLIPAYSGGIEPKYAVPATTAVASVPDRTGK